MFTPIRSDTRVERPGWVWPAVALEAFTAVGAIPVGWALVTDTTGGTVGLPPGWIEATAFGSYLVPGLYLLAMNGVGMAVLAAMTVRRDRAAPWLTGVLGTGLVIWILVQLVVMPEASPLQLVFGATGVALMATSVAWLRRTGQLRLP